jgi:hypothetical protein
LPWCAGVPVRGTCRTETVPLAMELIEGYGAWGEREPGRGSAMAGLQAGCLRTPSDPGREADASPE